MTTLARAGGLRKAEPERNVPSPQVGSRLLMDRLHEESDRQVPFSQAKLLLREAATAIHQLESALTRVTAELEEERALRRAP